MELPVRLPPADQLREGRRGLSLGTYWGRVLTRSVAVRHILARLGGLLRVLAIVSGVFPARVLDRAYDAAAVRRRLFAAPSESCPVIPKHLRGSFAS